MYLTLSSASSPASRAINPISSSKISVRLRLCVCVCVCVRVCVCVTQSRVASFPGLATGMSNAVLCMPRCQSISLTYQFQPALLGSEYSTHAQLLITRYRHTYIHTYIHTYTASDKTSTHLACMITSITLRFLATSTQFDK